LGRGETKCVVHHSSRQVSATLRLGGSGAGSQGAAARRVFGLPSSLAIRERLAPRWDGCRRLPIE
jgi:hypothetical protein